jgi:flagellin
MLELKHQPLTITTNMSVYVWLEEPMVSSINSAVSAQTLKLLGINSKQISQNLASLASGNRLVDASTDIAALSVATGMQSELSSLRSASQNISEASSLMQVADGGMGQITLMLDRMNAIATQANNGSLSQSAREGLNTEFQNLADEIDRISGNTEFGGIKLLDGSLSEDEAASFQVGSSAEDAVRLAIGNVGTAGLFADGVPNLLTADASAQALSSVRSAMDYITSQRANLGSAQEALSYTAANVDTAIQNQEAARASLADTDFLSASTQNAALELRSKAGIATLAQGNKLSGNLLSLLGG